MAVKTVDLEAAYYNSIYEILTSGKTSLNMPISSFAKKNVDTLLKKASDPHSANVAVKTLTDLVKETKDYLESREQQDADYTEYLINRKLIPWQKEYFVDNARRLTMQSGRRSGKTYANALKALKHCLVGSDYISGIYKTRKCVIVGLTKEKCQEQYWQLLKDTIKECHINTIKIDNALLSIMFASGATLKLCGNNSKAEREKLRGDEYSLIIIDEAQSQQGLRYLMESIFEPIAYGRDSQIILSGTGALILGSYWADVTDGELASKWRHYHNTMKDNPTIANADEVLKQVLIDKGWTEDEPEYIREYLGQNAYDATRSIVPIRQYYETIPEGTYDHCIIGTDYGWSDKTSFVPVLVAKDGKCYVVDEFSSSHLSASDIVAKAKEIEEYFRTKYKVPNILFIADTSDQTISADIYRNGIKIQNAYKVDERMQWSYLRDACRVGDVLMKKGNKVDREAEQAVWKYDEDKKQVIQECDDDVFHPDALDALKYAYYYIKTKKTSASSWKKQ